MRVLSNSALFKSIMDALKLRRISITPTSYLNTPHVTMKNLVCTDR